LVLKWAAGYFRIYNRELDRVAKEKKDVEEEYEEEEEEGDEQDEQEEDAEGEEEDQEEDDLPELLQDVVDSKGKEEEVDDDDDDDDDYDDDFANELAAMDEYYEFFEHSVSEDEEAFDLEVDSDSHAESGWEQNQAKIEDQTVEHNNAVQDENLELEDVLLVEDPEVVRRSLEESRKRKRQEDRDRLRQERLKQKLEQLMDEIQVEDEDVESRKIETILNHQQEVDGSYRYYVKWFGWPSTFNRWIQEDDIEDAAIIKAYHK